MLTRVLTQLKKLFSVAIALTLAGAVFVVLPARASEQGKVIVVGDHVYIFVCRQKKNLNRTLVIDSPFQIFAVGLLIEFTD